MGRVARRGIVVNDLLRGRGAWLGAWLLSHLATRNRYTRNDAPLSVRRAYTASELMSLVAAAGLRVESATARRAAAAPGGADGHGRAREQPGRARLR